MPAAPKDAAVQRLAGVATVVFSHAPERSVYNNALLERALLAAYRVDALDAMEAAYTTANVDRFAAWVHESDPAMRRELERRGHRIETTTRAMGMVLDETRLPRPQIDLARPDWREPLRIAGVPPDFLVGADPAAYRVALARLDGEIVATVMAYEADGDSGIYNVGTLAHARPGASEVESPPRFYATRSRAAAKRQACRQRRWRSGSMPRSDSATSVGSSSTCLPRHRRTARTPAEFALRCGSALARTNDAKQNN